MKDFGKLLFFLKRPDHGQVHSFVLENSLRDSPQILWLDRLYFFGHLGWGVNFFF